MSKDLTWNSGEPSQESGIKTNTSFQKRNINPFVKYGGGGVMVWVCFVEYPERERPAMNQAKLHQQVTPQEGLNNSKKNFIKVLEWLSQSLDLNPIEILRCASSFSIQRSVGKTSSTVTHCRFSKRRDDSYCCRGPHNHLLGLGGKYLFPHWAGLVRVSFNAVCLLRLSFYHVKTGSPSKSFRG